VKVSPLAVVATPPMNGEGAKDAIIGGALDSPTLEEAQKRTLREALTANADASETQAAVKLALAAQRQQQFFPYLFDFDKSGNAAGDSSYTVASAFPPSDPSDNVRVAQVLAMNKKPKIASYPSGTRGDAFIDKVALAQIVETGALAAPLDKPGAAPPITPAGLVLDPDFAVGVHAIYATIGKVVWNASPAANDQKLSAAKLIAFSNPRLAATTLSTIGKVDFGKPIAYTIDDKKLVVEPSLRKRFDVYWIDFAFSPSEEVINSSSELDFSVALTDHDSMALQLAPRELEQTAAGAAPFIQTKPNIPPARARR
jgi:hypothetical protein